MNEFVVYQKDKKCLLRPSQEANAGVWIIVFKGFESNTAYCDYPEKSGHYTET